jgi:hypothetical protein
VRYCVDSGFSGNTTRATVRVDDSSNRTITTKNGTFNLNNVALDATITISFIGYESSQFTANELFSAEKNCRKSS